MGVYAAALAPRDGVALPAGVAFSAYHTFTSDGLDNESGDDYQQAVQERYRVIGAPTWTEMAVVLGSQSHVVYPVLSAGNYERQVRVQGTVLGTWSAYTPSAFFTMSTTPNAPTLSAPAVAATIAGPTATVSWSVPASNEGYEVQVRTATAGGGTLEWTSGQVLLNVQTMTAQFPGQGTRHIRARIRNGGIWGAWADRQVTVSYVAPMVPTITSAIATDTGSLGALHTILITPNHPAPTGGAPTVTTQDVYVRHSDDLVERLVASGVAVGAYTYRLPSATQYQVRVVARSADGRTSTSAWATVSGVNTIKGFMLHDPANPAGTVRAFRYNDEGAEDTFDIEAALVEYQGREFPVAEFGDSSTRSISIDLIHSKGSGDAAALLAFLRLRKVLCYRDSKGRKAYGLLKLGATRDTFYGFTTGLTITQTDYPADLDVS